MAMVYYGLQLLSPNYFYMTAAVICAVISASIGSSWTVVGTIGIGLMGIALEHGPKPGDCRRRDNFRRLFRRHLLAAFGLGQSRRRGRRRSTSTSTCARLP